MSSICWSFSLGQFVEYLAVMFHIVFILGFSLYLAFEVLLGFDLQDGRHGKAWGLAYKDGQSLNYSFHYFWFHSAVKIRFFVCLCGFLLIWLWNWTMHWNVYTWPLGFYLGFCFIVGCLPFSGWIIISLDQGAVDINQIGLAFSCKYKAVLRLDTTAQPSHIWLLLWGMRSR